MFRNVNVLIEVLFDILIVLTIEHILVSGPHFHVDFKVDPFIKQNINCYKLLF